MAGSIEEHSPPVRGRNQQAHTAHPSALGRERDDFYGSGDRSTVFHFDAIPVGPLAGPAPVRVNTEVRHLGRFEEGPQRFVMGYERACEHFPKRREIDGRAGMVSSEVGQRHHPPRPIGYGLRQHVGEESPARREAVATVGGDRNEAGKRLVARDSRHECVTTRADHQSLGRGPVRGLVEHDARDVAQVVGHRSGQPSSVGSDGSEVLGPECRCDRSSEIALEERRIGAGGGHDIFVPEHDTRSARNHVLSDVDHLPRARIVLGPESGRDRRSELREPIDEGRVVGASGAPVDLEPGGGRSLLVAPPRRVRTRRGRRGPGSARGPRARRDPGQSFGELKCRRVDGKLVGLGRGLSEPARARQEEPAVGRGPDAPRVGGDRRLQTYDAGLPGRNRGGERNGNPLQERPGDLRSLGARRLSVHLGLRYRESSTQVEIHRVLGGSAVDTDGELAAHADAGGIAGVHRDLGPGDRLGLRNGGEGQEPENPEPEHLCGAQSRARPQIAS